MVTNNNNNKSVHESLIQLQNSCVDVKYDKQGFMFKYSTVNGLSKYFKEKCKKLNLDLGIRIIEIPETNTTQYLTDNELPKGKSGPDATHRWTSRSFFKGFVFNKNGEEIEIGSGYYSGTNKTSDFADGSKNTIARRYIYYTAMGIKDSSDGDDPNNVFNKEEEIVDVTPPKKSVTTPTKPIEPPLEKQTTSNVKKVGEVSNISLLQEFISESSEAQAFMNSNKTIIQLMDDGLKKYNVNTIYEFSEEVQSKFINIIKKELTQGV